MARKAFTTQKLVNSFPPWSDIRTDEQSLGYQLINHIAGDPMERLLQQLSRITRNTQLSTAVISDPDIYYSVRLPATYEFVKSDDDETELLFDAPTVSGTSGSDSYAVAQAPNNNIEGFWTEAVPTRVSLGDTASGEFVLASGLITACPLYPRTPEGELTVENNLYITVSGADTFIDFVDGELRHGIVQVDGTTRAGVNLTEECHGFVYDDTCPTLHEFSTVSGIRAYNIDDPDTAFLTVASARYNSGPYPMAYDLAQSDGGQSIPLFWNVGRNSTTDISQLSLFKYDIDDWDVRMAGYLEMSSILDIELLDGAANNINALDMAVEPNSNRLWIVSPTKLYLYSSDIPFPDLSVLTEKNYDARCRIEPSTYRTVLNNTVDLDYVWRRQMPGLVKHRVWVEKPDGTKKSIIDGAEATYTTGYDSWKWGEPVIGRMVRPSDTFTLDQRGDWIFSLECYYGDDTYSIDQRVVSVVYKQPLAEFTLPVSRPIYGIDIDSQNRIWVLDDINQHYEIVLHWDLMLIDFERKVIYFREPYDNVRVF